MADTVIVVGTKRGQERVPSSEIRQMVGRAGRRHDGGTSKAIILVEEEWEEDVRKEMADDGSVDVVSKLAEPDELAFHLLPEICIGAVSDLSEANLWYSRSLGAFQGIKAKVEDALDLLCASETAMWSGFDYSPTEMGQIAASLYFHPVDIKAWKDNFGRVFELSMECDDAAIAWALGNVSLSRVNIGELGKQWQAIEDFRISLPPGLDITRGCVTTIALWWSALGQAPMGKVRNQVVMLREDSGRVCKAMKEIDKRVTKWGMEDFFDELAGRLRRGIPSHLVDLCRFDGITKNRALWLYEQGVRDKQGIKDLVETMAEDEVDEKFMETLKVVANGIH